MLALTRREQPNKKNWTWQKKKGGEHEEGKNP
jgi:hypothetical protein